MTFIKSILLIVLILILILSLFIYQANYSINNTILSGSFITETLNESGIISAARDYAETEIENLDLGNILKGENGEDIELPQEILDNKDIIVKKIDFNFIETQIDNFTKGTILYMTNENKRLPVIEFKPLINMLFNGFIDITLRMGNAVDSTENINKAKEIFGEAVGIENVKESIDLSNAFSRYFGQTHNPIEDSRDILAGYKKIINYYFPLLLLILLFLIILVGFKPKWIFGWLAPVCIICGFVFIIGGFVIKAPEMFIQTNVTEITSTFPEIFDEPLLFIVRSIINKFFLLYLINGGILFALGIIFIIISVSIKGKQKTYYQAIQPGIQQEYSNMKPTFARNRTLGVVLRIILFLVVLYMGYYICNTAYNDMSNRVVKIEETIEYMKTQSDKDTNKILTEITGLNFEMLMGEEKIVIPDINN